MIRRLALILVGLIAALHFYIAYFEMFAWEERGPAVFPDFPPDLFSQTVVLALNQGLYNGFLAVGLVWSLLIKDRQWQENVALCFLLFVAIAGIVGAASASPRILMIQTLPAAVAMLLLFVARQRR